ncbi:CxC2 domain-containing protein [Mycena indigotica]|uniref:CxC2 domain-containing protein n=1 Tax=Mycena indigotica TaxID=2126181 RepID=A0A8H6VUQ0_9AGAR|nr:CxC2 domain-containing protein [Mycena indigotica]KAF7288924.1 CxC2 domain-containing protein [Mycena indigotica]
MARRGRRSVLENLGDVIYDIPLMSVPPGDHQVHVSEDGARAYTQKVSLVNNGTGFGVDELAEEDIRLAGWTPLLAPTGSDLRVIAQTVSSYDTHPDDEEGAATEKRKRYASSDDPLSVWLPHAPLFLDELIRREGLGDFIHHPKCAFCPAKYGTPDVRLFKCKHCGEYLQCHNCVVTQHMRQPLHVVKEWNGEFWSRTLLHSPLRGPEGEKGLGMVFQLGHHGFPCANPGTIKRMVIVDVRGVFTLATQSCNCNIGQRRNILQQLIAHGWYPATTTDPATCVTLEALELFRLLKVVGNVNAHDFVGSLECLNDPARVETTPDRYKSFLLCARQHAYLMQAKRAGRGHEENGLELTPKGGLYVECWACPHDGRNLPVGWQNVKSGQSYLYKLMLSVDANFRLKNRLRKNQRSDPALGRGQSYFVENEAYHRHLKDYVAEKDVTTCAAFAALMQKDTKLTTGLRVSGVGGVICARHGLVRRRGIGDLQKGERYANMDFIVLATLEGETITSVTISYDVRGDIQVDLSAITIQYALPVWHASAHETSCRSNNTLKYAWGVGKTDGEGIERTWSLLNPISWSTKEMGPGGQQDTIEDKIDHLNFGKNIGLGSTLMRKLIVALAESATQDEEFAEMCENVASDTLKNWEATVNEWEADHSKPNPYLVVGGTEAGPSERDILADLKAAELEDVRAGLIPMMEGGKMTAAAFVKNGLVIEESQRRILAELESKTLLSADRSGAIQEQRFALLKKLKSWEQLQLSYMPGAEELRIAEDNRRPAEVAPPKAELTKLYFPSDIVLPQRNVICARGVIEAEAKLRMGQCADALTSLRGYLYTQAHLVYWRNANSVGQKQSTRSATLLARVGERIRRVSAKYRRAYEALVALKGVDFAPQFRKLEPGDINKRAEVEKDIQAMKKLRAAESGRASRNEPTQGALNATTSWIWTVQGGVDQALHDSVRVDWSKARARRDRWREEVALLREEMKRVLRSLATIQRDWRNRMEERSGVDVGLASGLKAYAQSQMALYKAVGESFFASWSQPALGAIAAAQSPDLLRGLLEGTAEEILELDIGTEETVPPERVGGETEVNATPRYATRAQVRAREGVE